MTDKADTDERTKTAIVAAYLRQAARIAEETTTELRRRYPKLLKPLSNIEDDA